MLNANRTVIICKCHVILIHESIFSLFRWAWVTVLHANFMPIMRCLRHFPTLGVHKSASGAGSYRFNSASTDETTDTRSAMINNAGRLRNTWVLHASLASRIVEPRSFCSHQTFAFLFNHTFSCLSIFHMS